MNPVKDKIPVMESLLNDADRAELSRIFAPTVVAVPPYDARCGICVMPDGELRHYGYRDRTDFRDFSHPLYIASRDCGLTWSRHLSSEDRLTAASGVELTDGSYLSLSAPRLAETGLSLASLGCTDGFWAIRSRSPDDTDFTLNKITDLPLFDMFLPVGLSTGRIAVTATVEQDGFAHPVFLFSDDLGKTWDLRILDHAPKHEITWPHKGLRWQNTGNEPAVAELNDGSLYMLFRTSRDFFYEARSYDGGETWTKPVPSPFHGTLTTPQLLKLSDGRLLCFFCNTQPLPEQDHTKQFPPLWENEINGEGGEDVFTNRDANHVAISEDDGKTWIGFRELALNPIRNDSDYRTEGGHSDSLDKSVHQFQALELPMHKILVAYGQNPIARKLVIFDVDWLYEKERSEDFRLGLKNVSTQVYLKSVSGNLRVAGHCSWNRTHGAVLMPDPDGNFEEALFISRVDDPRLFSATQGVVWNFPAAHAGSVTVRLRIEGGPIHLSLCDHWFNPIDETVPDLAQVTCTLTRKDLPAGRFYDVTVDWDDTHASLSCEGKTLWTGSIRVLPQDGLPQGGLPHGISYLILQGPFEGVDTQGCYIKRLDMKAAKTRPADKG